MRVCVDKDYGEAKLGRVWFAAMDDDGRVSG
jgi:hypothetical protein